MAPNNRLLYFEYTLKKLLEWNSSFTGSEEINDFSILKCLKLLFFVSAAKAAENISSPLLEEVFDNYYAMPYGHVESNIYDVLKKQGGSLTYYCIDNYRTRRMEGKDNFEDFRQLDFNITQDILDSIEIIKYKNPNLVQLSAFELVELSHAWYSWQKYYNLAKANGQASMQIPASIIKSEDKLFSLSVY